MSFEAFAFALGSFYSKQKKAKKSKPKKSYNNWFEKLQLGELKSLCRASRLPVSGTKAALSERLCHGEFSSPYEYDFSNEGLKSMCREKNLIVSGKRYDLVLRLIQDETGVGGAPKRAAGTVDEEGNFQPKKRAKSMKVPDVEKIKQRIFKKFFPPDEVTFKWSNNKHKYHPTECLKFANNIIEKEVFEKELFQRGEEKAAWDVINCILYRFTVGDLESRQEWAAKEAAKGGMVMMIGGTEIEFGRCSWELKWDFLPKIVKAIRMTSSKSVLEELAGDTLWEFQRRKLSSAWCSSYDEVYIHEENKTSSFNNKTESFKAILSEHIPRESKSDDDE